MSNLKCLVFGEKTQTTRDTDPRYDVGNCPHLAHASTQRHCRIPAVSLSCSPVLDPDDVLRCHESLAAWDRHGYLCRRRVSGARREDFCDEQIF